MKIEKIVYKSHPFFKENFEVNFKNWDNTPFITYLVWNNWSGKTLILKNIADMITWNNQWWWNFITECKLHVNESEKNILQVLHDSCTYNYERINDSSTRSNFIDYSWNKLQINEYKQIFKLTYSRVEVNFSNERIATVTSKNIDENEPRDVSNALNIEIPQLLVDIKSIDDSEIADWVKEHNGSVQNLPDYIWKRLDRFTNAFNKIYCWSKIFKKIDNQDQQKVILFQDSEWREVDISKFSSGEQQVLYRIGYLLKNLWTLSWWIILIDEPEISLHPIWQERFRELLIEVFWNLDIQIIIATHSPYIYRKIDNTKEQVLKINGGLWESIKLDTDFCLIWDKLSTSYINYIAYDIVDYQLHIELYDSLLRKFLWEESDSPSRLDNILIHDYNEPIEVTFTKTWATEETNETIMTRIRNKMHHPSERNRPDFSEEKMKESIEKMIHLLKL